MNSVVCVISVGYVFGSWRASHSDVVRKRSSGLWVVLVWATSRWCRWVTPFWLIVLKNAVMCVCRVDWCGMGSRGVSLVKSSVVVWPDHGYGRAGFHIIGWVKMSRKVVFGMWVSVCLLGRSDTGSRVTCWRGGRFRHALRSCFQYGGVSGWMSVKSQELRRMSRPWFAKL